MRQRSPWFLVAAIALAAGSGCNCNGAGEPDGGADGGDGGPGLGPEVYCAAVAKARCARESGCGFLDVGEEETCADRTAAACLQDFARVDAGHAAFVEPAARACLAAIPRAPCIEGPFPGQPECAFHTVFRAAGALGTTCVDSADCLNGFCFGGLRDCRTCRPFVAADQPCTALSSQCDPSTSFCGPDDAGVNGCRARLADSVPCLGHRECASGRCNWNGNLADGGPDVCGKLPLDAPCADFLDCIDDGWCEGYAFDGQQVTPGVCARRRALDAGCANHPEDDGCVGPASCLEGRCVTPAPYSLGAGAECEDLGQCAEPYFCRDYQARQLDGGPSLRAGTCTPRLAAGSPCRFSLYLDTDCSETTTCGAGGTCIPRRAPGEGCGASYECRDFLTCPAATQLCQPYGQRGDSCGAGVHCAEGAGDGRCADGGATALCAELLPAGSACALTQPRDCASGRCFATDGGAPACQAACFP